MISFLKKYDEYGRYVFWPDFATAHYAKNAIATLNKFGIKFVERVHNLPNVLIYDQLKSFGVSLSLMFIKMTSKLKVLIT